EYIVSTGMKNCSPVGTFKVIGKSSRPGKADLGTRWMAINRWHTRTGRQFGIHGTNEPQYLGQQRSRGCIRLSNADVEELYDETSVNTAIVIQDGQLPDISSNNFAQVASCYQKENTQ
ncbi:MAG: L,D-transpeptidase, partial [bacterium]